MYIKYPISKYAFLFLSGSYVAFNQFDLNGHFELSEIDQ